MHAYSKKLTLGICSRRQMDSQSNFCYNCYSNNSCNLNQGEINSRD